MKKLATIILSTLITIPAIAASNSTIFSCTTTEGKQLDIQKSGSDYLLNYGKISFKNSIKSVIENENTEIAVGSGFISLSMELVNNEYQYNIGYMEPRDNSRKKIEPGGNITKNGESVEIIECNPKKPVHINFDKKIMRKTGLAS